MNRSDPRQVKYIPLEPAPLLRAPLRAPLRPSMRETTELAMSYGKISNRNQAHTVLAKGVIQ